MHIADGLLPAQVCLGGYGITGLLLHQSLRRIDRRPNPKAEVPKASLLTAAFFVASSLYIPLPPTSVHLVLNGLVGVILADYAFPAILIGLLFQALVFGHGGLTTLGINGVIMGVPALLASGIFRYRPAGVAREPIAGSQPRPFTLGLFAFCAGAVGVGLSALFFFGIVLATLPLDMATHTERRILYGLLLAHGPLMVLEGIFTLLVVLFLHRVKPSLLPPPARRVAPAAPLQETP